MASEEQRKKWRDAYRRQQEAKGFTVHERGKITRALLGKNLDDPRMSIVTAHELDQPTFLITRGDTLEVERWLRAPTPADKSSTAGIPNSHDRSHRRSKLPDHLL